MTKDEALKRGVKDMKSEHANTGFLMFYKCGYSSEELVEKGPQPASHCVYLRGYHYDENNWEQTFFGHNSFGNYRQRVVIESAKEREMVFH